MLKLTVLIVCLALIGQSLCQAGVPKAQVDARVQESAEWAAARMGAYIKQSGDYYLQRYSNLKSVVDKESLYSMTLDVLIADRNANKQSFKQCDVEVIDDPIQNKRLLKSASCKDNQSF